MHIDPKAELAKRSAYNWALCIVCFLAWAFLAGLLIPGPLRLVAYGIGIAIAYYVLFHLLEPSPLIISCPECRKNIATNTPWKCGFCDAENRRANEVPFTEPCESCGATPKAYQCHHTKDSKKCEKIIFLSPDELEQKYARCLDSGEESKPAETQPTPSEVRAEAMAAAKHDIEMARLKEELEKRQKAAQPTTPKTVQELLKEDFDNDYGQKMGAKERAKLEEAIVREKFKGDKKGLKDALDTIKAWASKHTTD